ncbi:restriction endonuclease subunit S [Acaryochloris marina]|uniref:restriction endonuclease subunit S n=1 Tax=Acaryochloris marina TaxID=155978 RepID=UPI001BB0241A|nr:restriction endonuclease subunit S [Acaryochloris marina]QUY45602.1 restriction endonuclease subunit S [Acaryochloris marina S15]
MSSEKLPKGYKQTEVGVIPEDWELDTIGQSMRLINGRAFKPSDWTDQGTPIIRIQNLNDSNASFNYCSDATYIEDKHRLEVGDLVFAWSGTKGSSFGARIWPGPCGVLNQHIFKIIANKDKLTHQYAFLTLLKVQEDIEKHAHGFKASFVHVKKADLVGVQLAVPPIKEQKAIATTLSDTDALIEALEQLIAKKRHIKQGTMQELLTGKRRLPGFGEGKGYKQTEIGVIPEDWDLENFGNLVDYTKGYAFKSEEYTDCGVRIVRVSDTTFDTINNDNAVFINANSVYEYRKWKLREYDLIFSTVGSKPPMYDSLVGKAILVTQQHAGSLLNQNAVLIRAKRYSAETQCFLLNHFRTERYINYIEIIFRGNANQASITLEDLFKFKLPLPSSEEQEAIATILSDMDTEIATLEAKLIKTRQLKQGMMHNLLTGRIRLV